MHPSPNMKLHHLGDHSLMWSSVLQAPHPTRPTKASDQSLGSSFGCSFGSFNVNDSSTGNLINMPLNIKVVLNTTVKYLSNKRWTVKQYGRHSKYYLLFNFL